jgi:hypothetical protein
MKKFNMAEIKPVSTPMSMGTVLDPHEMARMLTKEGIGA